MKKCIACGYAEGGKVSGPRALASDRLSEKGVHVGMPNRDSAGTHHAMSISPAGYSTRAGNTASAKKEHKKVLEEGRKINPKLQGLAKGGCVNCGFNMSRYKK